jgi:hypothetical protein
MYIMSVVSLSGELFHISLLGMEFLIILSKQYGRVSELIFNVCDCSM